MTSADPTFEGVYGTYSINAADRQEVRFYRIALLITGLSLAAGVLQWWQTDSPWAWRQRFYALPGVADTCDGNAWRNDYFGALFPLNPGGIVPAGPDLSTLVNSTAASG